jgi:hypothetical protein
LKSGLIRGIASPVGDMFVVIYIWRSFCWKHNLVI